MSKSTIRELKDYIEVLEARIIEARKDLVLYRFQCEMLEWHVYWRVVYGV